MKKKVLYGFAMALIASVSMGTLQSCKDDLSDFKHQYNYDQAGVNEWLGKLQGQVDECQKTCDSRIKDLQKQITTNKLGIDTLKGKVSDLALLINDRVTYKDLKLKVDSLHTAWSAEWKQNTKDSINAALAPVLGDIKNLKANDSTLNVKISGLNANFVSLDSLVKADLPKLGLRIDSINDRVEKVESRVEIAEKALTAVDSTLTAIKPLIQENAAAIDTLQTGFKQLLNEVDLIYQEIADAKQQISSVYNALMDEIDDRMDEVDNKFMALTARLDALITGIIVQGTDSPVFGNFSLPLGVQSNILFNWYGFNDNRDFQFPSASNMDNYYDENPVLTQADLAALAPAYQDVKKGYLGDVNLGKLYMTINPAGHIFNEDNFVLESSAENAYPATLKVKKSNDELTFGYSRATVEGNGFYEADVIVETANIDAAKMEIQDGLKSTVEAALKDPSKRTAVGLLKGVYSQVNNTLPAYAVRYNWSANEKDYSVLSNYEVAATTAKPLSYAFLYGKGTDKRLRTFGHLDNFINRLIEEHRNIIKIEGQDIEVLGHKIGFAKGDISIGKESVDKLFAVVTGVTVDGTEIPAVRTDFSDPSEASLYINKALAEALAKSIGKEGDRETIARFEASVSIMLLQMQKQINEVLDSVNGQVQDAIDSVGDKVESYAKRLNRLVDLYNKVAGKINGFLANPNHYLQVAMFYNQGSTNVGVLSNTIASPTIFNRANGEFCLYASSYTAELVCPAYLKYVAVTNIYDAATKKSVNPSAADLKALNAKGKHLNEVMPGETIRFGIAASSLETGKIYEIAYQGVDYSGRTSTQKFYIQVK